MFKIRIATPQDSAAIGRIIKNESMHFLVDPEGMEAQNFFESLQPYAVEKTMAESNRRYHVAEDKGQVFGMIMVRDNNYISQFFVAGLYQGQGIGSALWRNALQSAILAGGTGQFDVDSSLIAQPVYKKFGFSSVGVPTVSNGFKFIPMRRLADSDA